MLRTHGPGVTVLKLAALALAFIVPMFSATTLSAASQIPSASEPLATVPLVLATGELAWQVTELQTSAESDPAMAFEPGFVYALDDPLLLLFDDGTPLERLQADNAFAVDASTQGHPIPMMAEAAVPFLTIAVGPPSDTDEPDATPFVIEGGEYELSLWLIDTAQPVSEEIGQRLVAQQHPLMVLVRSGEVDAPPASEGDEPRHLAAGDWTAIAPGAQLSGAEGATPPVLLFATLDQPDQKAAQPGGPATGSGPTMPQGGGNQGPTGGISPPQGGNAQPTMVATTAPTMEPTAEPAVEPTTVPPAEAPAEPTTESDPGGSGDGSIGAPGCSAPSGDLSIFTTDPDVANSRVADTGVASQVELTCTAFTADADGDGLSDACEVEYGTKPDVSDSDGDSLSDGNEVYTYRTNPAKFDTDEDGLDDGYDLGGGTDPLDSDFDNDSLLDGDEVNVYGTYPKVYDSDEDGLNDGEEINLFGTKPLVYDTDQDMLADGDEVYIYGTSPTDIYTDEDCLMDSEVTFYGTSPLLWDTDGDGYSDWLEVEYGGSPLDPGDTPSDGVLEPTYIDSYC